MDRERTGGGDRGQPVPAGSTPAACRSTRGRWRRATCSSPCSARAATGMRSSPMRLPGARRARWCMLTYRQPGRLLRVDDTLAGLTRLGAFARSRFGDDAGRLVAVTGSVGKTTTKEMLRRALSGVRPDPCRRGVVQQSLGRAADPGPHAPRRQILRRRDRHEPRRARSRRWPVWPARMSPSITTIAKAHVGHLGSIAGDRRREGQHHARAGTGRHRGAARWIAAVRAGCGRLPATPPC